MAENRIICNCKQVDYLTIRRAMIAGARTIDDIREMTGACTVCGGCEEEIQKILLSVCGCKDVSLAQVLEAVKGGADTVEKVGALTGAGTGCGHCQPLIQNIIDLGR